MNSKKKNDAQASGLAGPSHMTMVDPNGPPPPYNGMGPKMGYPHQPMVSMYGMHHDGRMVRGPIGPMDKAVRLPNKNMGVPRAPIGQARRPIGYTNGPHGYMRGQMHPQMMRPGAHPDMQQSGFPLSDKLKTLYRPDQGQIMQPSGPTIYPDVPETRQDWYAANGQMLRMGQRGNHAIPASQQQQGIPASMPMQADMNRMGGQQNVRMMQNGMQKINQPPMGGFDNSIGAQMQPDIAATGNDPNVQNAIGVAKSPFMGNL